MIRYRTQALLLIRQRHHTPPLGTNHTHTHTQPPMTKKKKKLKRKIPERARKMHTTKKIIISVFGNERNEGQGFCFVFSLVGG